MGMEEIVLILVFFFNCVICRQETRSSLQNASPREVAARQ